MKTLKILALAAGALGLAALATPAQARDHHHRDGRHYSHWDGNRHGRVIVYSAPRSYYSRSYYRPYYYDDYYSPGYSYYSPSSYYAPYSYSGGPSVSFAFGGHGYRHYHHHR